MFSYSSEESSREVVVTGLGMVTPLGLSAEPSWRRLLAGDQACRALTAADIDHFESLNHIPGLQLHGAPVDIAGVAQRLTASSLLSKISERIAKVWLEEPLISMSLLALQEAVDQACLSIPVSDPARAAVVFGSSKGGLRTAEQLVPTVRSGFDERWADRFAHSFTPDSATRAVAAVTDARMSASCPVAACATGLISVLQGAALIASGHCDVCFVGSADAGLRASVLSSFHRLRVTSRHPQAESACRPFDQNRDGFVIGEGAAVMILESRSHALARGAAPMARVAGGGWLSDPTGMTQIDASGTIVTELLKRIAVQDCTPEMIGLHGTGTESNDLAEARGVHSVFGREPHCFGVKGAIGHLLGAAGSVETAFTLLALRDGLVPGTTNLDDIDQACSIRISPQPVRLPHVASALKLSLGFGGHVACGIFESEA